MPWDTKERQNPPWTLREDAVILGEQSKRLDARDLLALLPRLPGRTIGALRNRSWQLRRRDGQT